MFRLTTMSAIAEFRLIPVHRLNELMDAATMKVEKSWFSTKVTDRYATFLQEASIAMDPFEYSGYVYAALLVFLKEQRKIDLFKNEYAAVSTELSARRKNTTLVLCARQFRDYAHELVPDQFTVGELMRFNEEFSEEDDPDLAAIQLEAIRILRSNLSKIPDDEHVAILTID